MLRKLPGRSAHAVTRLLRGHRHSSRTSLHQYVHMLLEMSARPTSLLEHTLCLLVGNQEDKEQETHCECVQSEPLHVCLV
jgi:hypothetical protein